MRQIEDPASEALTVLQALESLARLAWNDDDVREQVAQMDGMHHATCMIRQHAVKAESIASIPTKQKSSLLSGSTGLQTLSPQASTPTKQKSSLLSGSIGLQTS